MAASIFDAIMRETAVPALESVFGTAATHINADSDEMDVIVIRGMELMAVGEYGECMEQRATIEISKTAGVVIGDTFVIENNPTESEPTPDPTTLKITQLIADDDYLQKFAVIEITES